MKLPTNHIDKKKRRSLLYQSILFDLIGMLSYLPFFSPLKDIIWAPIAAILLYRMYPGTAGKIGSVIVFLEELSPGLDFIPTYTLTWFYTFKFNKTE